MMAEEASLVQIDYADLIAFCDDDDDDDDDDNNSNNISTKNDDAKHDMILSQIQAAYGPEGLGILEIINVPDFEAQRQALLPLAAQLPHLPDLDSLVDEPSMYSIGWSHGKEMLQNQQPDTAKGSFYAKPFCDATTNRWPTTSLPHLEPAFRAMSRTLQEMGCRIAHVCDVYCASQGVPDTGLEQSLRASTNATGRLLHYFPTAQNTTSNDKKDTTPDAPAWCAWHRDHGTLTGLVPGLYLDAQQKPVDANARNSTGGLYIEQAAGRQYRVPCTSCAFQIGETAQIQSGGLLRATPHAVVASASSAVSRESFALFLEPNMEAPLEWPRHIVQDADGESSSSSSELQLPSIRPRWKPGGTFGEFHWNTIHMFAVKNE